MAKVIFEFDDKEEQKDILFTAERYKLLSAAYQLSDLYRGIYNGKLYDCDCISVKDNKVLTEEDYKKYAEMGPEYYPVKDIKQYISRDFIENTIDAILEDIRHLL